MKSFQSLLAALKIFIQNNKSATMKSHYKLFLLDGKKLFPVNCADRKDFLGWRDYGF